MSALRLLLLGRYLNGVSDKLYNSAEDLGVTVTLDMGACGYQDVKYFHQHTNDVDWVFVDHPSYHRAGGTPVPLLFYSQPLLPRNTILSLLIH